MDDEKLLYRIFFTFSIVNSVGQRTAIYSISFTSTWNETDHSDGGAIPLPSNPHWSNLVGTMHKSSISFFQNEMLASNGVEDVAEIGVHIEFNNEVSTAISNLDANQWLQVAFDPVGAIGTADLGEVTISEEYPLLTLISMIAPSPDWFVGVDSFSFLDGGDNWKPTTTIDLYIYDAGTEDGAMYGTNNSASNPHVNINSMVNIPLLILVKLER